MEEGERTHSDQRQQNPVHIFEKEKLKGERDIALPRQELGTQIAAQILNSSIISWS